MHLFEGRELKGGIYAHVPFCLKKCAYCNFYSVGNLALMDDYVAALLAEIEFKAQEAPPGFTADTLYFGGGTPSLLAPQQLASIIKAIGQNFALDTNSELTLEVNPATANLAKLKNYKDLGVNRLSIGMQSFNDKMLKRLGRVHKAADNLKIFDDARKAGFANISIDLIYGLPGQTKAALAYDVEQALALKAEHISAYMLTLEPETPLARQMEERAVPALSETFQRFAFDFTLQALAKGGYAQYEISNFSRRHAGQDYRSRHNLKYWNLAPYAGLGPAAHTFTHPNRRSWNVSVIETYLKRLAQNESVCENFETLNAEQMQMELIYLGLRQNRGINTAAFNALKAGDFSDVCRAPLQTLATANMIREENGFCALTAKGRPFLDYVTRTLINAL